MSPTYDTCPSGRLMHKAAKSMRPRRSWSRSATQWSVVSKLMVAVSLAIGLGGCPPPNMPPTNPSITISNERRGGHPGDPGIFFDMSGVGFTPNGRVNISLNSVPNRPSAIQLTNGPLLPDLFADGQGNFSAFHVAQDCTIHGPPDPGPVDIFVMAVDQTSTNFAVHRFAAVSFECQML